jgi:HlyD family secretion protein
MKKILPILLLLAAAGGGYWWWRDAHSTDPNRILVSGNLELTLVDMSFQVAGRMTELNVREGDWVKKGQVIARLDPMQAEQTKLRDQAAVISAESNYRQMETSIAFQKATLESDVAARRAEVNEAQARLDQLLNGSRKEDIQQAEAAANDARAQLDFARSDWARMQSLYKNEDISKQQFDQSRMKFDSATAQSHQAEQKLALVKAGPRVEEIAAARATLARTQASLRTSEANRLELLRKEQELRQRNAEIERSRGQEGISQSQLDNTVITSPIDGVVLVKSAEAGEVVAAGTTVVTIGDLDHPWLRAYINETDLGRVKLGQKVKLTTDSYKGKVYWGTVSFIASEAEFTPKQIQTKEERVKLVYRIKVDVDNSSHDLKNNMPVDAEIVL